ncbi:hypothetical protein ACFFX0_09090 [Citricoccus parietis]|uniref:Uncharacterized protein n=1 Tax=Citricoccus parietis TaxID=592307 RepID=A0ABV5FXE4_9MICC
MSWEAISARGPGCQSPVPRWSRPSPRAPPASAWTRRGPGRCDTARPNRH